MRPFPRPFTVLGILLVIAATVLGFGVSHALTPGKTLAAGPSVDWPRFGNNTNNNRFSSLTQINAGNVRRLGIAWTMQEGRNLSLFETDPVVVNGTMYFTTNTDQVVAVNAATGRLKWKYTPSVAFYRAVAGGGGGVPTNRGVTVANGHVYLLTFDDQLIALQAATGEKLWKTTVSSSFAGYSETSPPTYWNNMLFVGSAESDAGMRGFVAAFNASSGRQIWRTYMVPAPGHGWVPLLGNHGGGDVWMPPTVDTRTATVYVGTGNPSPDIYNANRPGCNPWVDAVVAMNAYTGRIKWAHTEVCPDLWDYDSHQPPMIFDIHTGGRTIHAVGHGNKSGYYWIVNAANGRVIAKSPGVVRETCCPRPRPTRQGVKVCPGASGGIEYTPAAYSPLTQAVYQPALQICNIFQLGTLADVNHHKQGAVDVGGAITPVKPFTGAMVAINTRNGRFMWRDQMPAPMIGGALATAGNLAFSGSDDGRFYAFNATNGRILWSANLGLPFGAAPITYMVNGVQYVAIAVGGSIIATSQNLNTGGTLVVFKLNGASVHRMPVVSAGFVPAKLTMPSLKGLNHINRWMWASARQQHVVIKVVANLGTNNSGLNFNGYSKGQANFIIPRGWNVDIEFSNTSKIPHSLAITSNHALPPKLVNFGFGPAVSPKATQGIGPGITELVTFPGVPAGSYNMVCLVPGHLVGGMWDRVTISPTARMPSIQVGKAM